MWLIGLEHAMRQADAADQRVKVANERIKRFAARNVDARVRQSRAVDRATQDEAYQRWTVANGVRAGDQAFRDAMDDWRYWTSEAMRYAAAIQATAAARSLKVKFS
jgi:hypothetical protein